MHKENLSRMRKVFSVRAGFEPAVPFGNDSLAVSWLRPLIHLTKWRRHIYNFLLIYCNRNFRFFATYFCMMIIICQIASGYFIIFSERMLILIVFLDTMR